jgi:glucose/arabinose dehydrogenase
MLKVNRNNITSKLYIFTLLCGVVIFYSCRTSEPTAKSSRSESTGKLSNIVGRSPINSNEKSAEHKDSLSYHITRSENNYPVVHIPLAMDSTSDVWRGIDLTPHAPILPQSPREEQKSFKLKKGYRIECVLSDPNIIQPAAIRFDGDGRMYVVELRGFMRGVNAKGETAPISRISRWTDTDNDGIYDHGTTFVDSLVFPRFVLPFGPNAVLTMNSNQGNIYKYIDTDGDGEADKKELFATGMGHVANLEGQTSSLTWAMDNWMYSTYNNVRIRWTPEGVIKDKIGYVRGEWGVTQDSYGKIWTEGGNSGIPEIFEFPIEYGNFHVKNRLAEDFREPYSLVQIGDYQPGMGAVKPDGSLKYFSGTAGNAIYRGDKLSHKLRGDYFFGAPMARIVGRVKITKKEGLTYLSNYYHPEKSEFIQSTDPLFRPLDIENAPDGTLYIADMYQGIIQEGTFTPQGSYLRAKIKQYGLGKIFNSGRIWRLTYKGRRDTTRAHMYDESAAQLVKHLKNPNGWWRDKAQQLLVMRQDKSVVPALRNMVENSRNEFARYHALWTLEGLDALNVKMVKKLMKDPDYHMRIQAIRASESLYKKGHHALMQAYEALTGDDNVNVVIQAMLTLNYLGAENTKRIVEKTMASNHAHGVQVVGNQLLKKIKKKNNLSLRNFTPKELKLYKKGVKIFSSVCSKCHGDNGKGKFIGESGKMIAPALAGSKIVEEHPEYVIKTVLHGLKGPIKGEAYATNIMPLQKMHSDKWVASVVSYIRNSMGNKASFVTPKYVSKIRKASSKQKGNYTYKELMASIPQLLEPQRGWNVTASSSVSASLGKGSSSSPFAAFSLSGWRTKSSQKPGMWFEIDFRKPVNLARIQFDNLKAMFPKMYIVQVSMDGKDWNTVAKGRGKKGQNTINFKAAQARYMRMKETATGDNPWAMRNLKLYVR